MINQLPKILIFLLIYYFLFLILIRDWIKSRCDPYKDVIPEVPDSIKNKVEEVYLIYTQKLTGKYLK